MLSKSRIFIFNAHLALFVHGMTQLQSHNSISKYCHLVFSKVNLELALEVKALPSPLQTRQQAETKGSSECEELRLRRGSH